MKEALNACERDKAQLLERFNSYGEQLQRQQLEMVEDAKLQYKEKLRAFKEALQECKRREQKQVDDLERERRDIGESKRSFEQAAMAMREDMRRIKEEWERRLSDEQLECQRQLVEMQAKQAMQIQGLQ